MNKFYNFYNENETKELYLYGAIVSDKWDETDVNFSDFKNALDEIKDNETLNIYVNSPGGEVFVTDSIIAMLDRCKKKKNITINCYIDGLGASCASWLPMVADSIYIYSQSVLMLHKPMSMVWGNASEMKKEIEVLDKIENSMIKMYLAKAKDEVTEEQIRNMLSEETWLSANEIQEYFNVELIESEKKIAACIDKDIFKNYKNVPDSLQVKEEPEKENVIDNEKLQEVENKIKDLEVYLELNR
ncbi:head maturation protease, ClpP-related [Clostridium cadaveris]|uniref:head maturation protease, ClpP-related n=1 Tax=Clostridium cadaveris TaxID=1529 RepID=UPI001E30E762|nr:head maturation protease, ClpP-related [Clostridium cadaveris]UFH66454.1 Clp protease ClpP [Clostridium cadaveris]